MYQSKVLIINLTIILLACLFLTFCSEDPTSPDNTKVSELAGIWRFSKITNIDSSGSSFVEIPEESGYIVILTMNNNGTYTVVEIGNNEIDTRGGTWQNSDGKLTIVEDGETFVMDYTLEEDKFNITYGDDSGTVIEEYIKTGSLGEYSFHGSWDLINMIVEYFGTVFVLDPSDQGIAAILTVNENGTYVNVYSENDSTTTTNGTWSINGNKVTTVENGETQESYYILAGDILIISSEEQGVPITREFTRK